MERKDGGSMKPATDSRPRLRGRGIRAFQRTGVAVGWILTSCAVGADDTELPLLNDDAEPASEVPTLGTAGARDTGPGPNPSLPSASCEGSASPGESPLRRLSRFEYDNTVRDLLGEGSAPASNTLPGEEAGNGFGNDANVLTVSRLLVDGLTSIAKRIAERATDAERLQQTAPCAAAGSGDLGAESTCADAFIYDFGLRAFRRPLEPREVQLLKSTYDMGVRVRGNYAAGVQAVVETILQAPQFLYRIEFGTPVADNPELLRPTDYEMATRLSYLFWGSTPDQSLLDAAAAGQLSTPEQILEHARRLLADPRARQMVTYFHDKLFGLEGLNRWERSTELYPSYTPAIGQLLKQETETFLEYVVFEGDGLLSTVYGSDFTFLNQPLAEFYGVPGVSGEAFQRVPLNPAQRKGVLTQAGIMMRQTPGNRSNPIVRAKWLMTNVLCQQIPDPPKELMVVEPEFVEGTTTRQRFSQHRQPSCEACHVLLDPLGLGFENFDGVGLWRDDEDGLPIDASGEVASSDIAGPFNGPVEFATKVAQSADAQSCYVSKWLTFSYGRTEDLQLDQCNRSVMLQAFEGSGGNIQQLLLAITQTDAFLYRSAK